MRDIMASGHPRRESVARRGPIRGRARWAWSALAAALAVAQVTTSPPEAAAQESPTPDQPLAIDGEAALVPSPCRLVVPPGQSVLQPMKIRPEQVPLKNRLGCLSPADAIYGPDGCPVRLCGPTKGVFPLAPP
jgi:hypothetical protein